MGFFTTYKVQQAKTYTIIKPQPLTKETIMAKNLRTVLKRDEAISNFIEYYLHDVILQFEEDG